MLPYLRHAARARRLCVPYNTRRLFFRRAHPENVQRVRFKTPAYVSRTASMLPFWVFCGVTYYYGGNVVDRWLGVRDGEDGELSDQKKTQMKKDEEQRGLQKATLEKLFEGEEEEDDDEPLFIPLGLVRRVPGDYYAETDPEWLLFTQASRSQKYMDKIKDVLIDISREKLSTNKKLCSVTGSPVEVASDRSWLTHEFPNQAPPQYVQSGLAFGDDYIAWAERRIPPETGDSIRRTFSAFPVFPALYTASSAFLDMKLDKIRAHFGYEQKLPRMPKPVQPLPQRNNGPAPETSDDIPGSSESEPSSSGKEDFPKTDMSLQIRRNQANPSVREEDVEASKEPTDFQRAASIFTRSLFLAEKVMRPRRSLPTTCFRVEGLVRLNGPEGFANVWVVGQFDLDANKFVSIGIDVKNATPHHTWPVKR